jgi:hypothetical protein
VHDFLIWVAAITAGVGFVYLRHRTPAWKRAPKPMPPPPPPPGPMGPRPPVGIQAPPPKPMTPEHRFGPKYLTGKIKELAEQAVVEIHQFTGQRSGTLDPETSLPLADMAADYIAAVRWWRVAVDPNTPDNYLFSEGGSERISTIIDTYRRLPLSRDRDQALSILGYYLPYDTVEGRDKGPLIGMVVAYKAWIAKGNPPARWNEYFDTSR